MEFLVYMQSPEYKYCLERQIETERLRKLDLNTEKDRLEKQIKQLQEDSTEQLKCRLDEVSSLYTYSCEICFPVFVSNIFSNLG